MLQALPIVATQIRFLEARTAPMILQAQQLCHDVYLEMGYIPAPCPMRVIPDAPGAAHTYIVAIDEQSLVVGTVRLSRQDPCWTFNIWSGRLYHQCSVLMNEARRRPAFELGALAVNRQFAHLKVSWGLYNMAYRWALANGLEYGIISMDQRAFRALEMVGWRAIRIGEAMMYRGSLTVPGIIPILEQPGFAAAKIQPWFNYSFA